MMLNKIDLSLYSKYQDRIYDIKIALDERIGAILYYIESQFPKMSINWYGASDTDDGSESWNIDKYYVHIFIDIKNSPENEDLMNLMSEIPVKWLLMNMSDVKKEIDSIIIPIKASLKDLQEKKKINISKREKALSKLTKTDRKVLGI